MSNNIEIKQEDFIETNNLKEYADMPLAQIAANSSNGNLAFEIIEMRLKDIEQSVFKKNKKNKATRAQKFLLLYPLGMLQALLDLEIKVDSKAKILSIILNEDYDNLHKNISQVHLPNSNLIIKDNFEFLKKVFSENELGKKSNQMAIKLQELAMLKDKEKKKI